MYAGLPVWVMAAMAFRKARILVLCKTYPSPSAAHTETSCVAGIEESGSPIRLYPVPFRLIETGAQFKKWQWITAQVEKANKDHRPESHRIGVDTISCETPIVSTHNGWAARLKWLDKMPSFRTFAAMEEARLKSGTTLALLRPTRILGLDITATSAEWTDEEKAKLLQLQKQGSLFGPNEAAKIATLRKVPFDFHYRYVCTGSDGVQIEMRHKISDWEVGALYWNVRRSHGNRWEDAFREKIEHDLPTKELIFLMGTIHRFPDQWLIISLIYPPKRQSEVSNQLSLL